LISWDRIQKIIEFSKPHLISYVANRETFSIPAVYLIHDTSKQLQYIGHTNSLQHRCQEHLLGIGAGNLCSKVKRRPTLPQKVEWYRIKYIKIPDYRDRCFTECMLLGSYRPPLNFTR